MSKLHLLNEIVESGRLRYKELNFRNVGSIGKRGRRDPRRNCDEMIYNFPNARTSRNEPKYPMDRGDYNPRREVDYAKSTIGSRNGRILIGSNVDSGLGESTPQDFSSCCSSSADSSARPSRPVRTSQPIIYLFRNVIPNPVNPAHSFPVPVQELIED